MKIKTKQLYWVTLFFITLSGFAQMPIFKRYYIADIPGLGWLNQFYVTHLIHYLAALVLIVMVFYLATGFILEKRSLSGITRSGAVKMGLLAVLMVSGGVLAYKNLAGVYMDHLLISLLDLVHLGSCMVLLGTGLYAVIRKREWVKK